MGVEEVVDIPKSTHSEPTMQIQHQESLPRPKETSSGEQDILEAVRIIAEKQAYLCKEHRTGLSELQRASDRLMHVQQSIAEHIEKLGKTQEDMQEINDLLQWIMSAEESAKGAAKKIVDKYKKSRTENMNNVFEKYI